MFPHHTDPSDDVWVAFDLETTGLDADKDAIIEIGAVKFQGGRTLDTFQSLVNPRRRISPFIASLTGIRQRDLDRADTIERVAAEFISFVGASPIIAHNADFDLGFLRSGGIELTNPVVDTYDLAYVVRPDSPSYSLENMAQHLELPHDRPHRALEDAIAAKMLFLNLLEDAASLDPMVLGAMQRLAQASNWSLAYLFNGLTTNSYSGQIVKVGDDGVGIDGLDRQQIKTRLRAGDALRENERSTHWVPTAVAEMLGEGGVLSRVLDNFEVRDEQLQMAHAVAKAINYGERIIIEAGTGVGKSLAYLLPAALYALTNNKRVVISTNTINLQEQLLHKDIPILVEALKGIVDGGEELRFTTLKGGANYLCMRRWDTMATSNEQTPDAARILAKTMLWLQSTATGDRAEINLGHPRAAAHWDRLAAQRRSVYCKKEIGEGVCFLQAARKRAAASHLIIVNHALLISDAIRGGLIPDYDTLIIDEAQHLEDVATDQLGFELTQAGFEDHLQLVNGTSGIINRVNIISRDATIAESRRVTIRQVNDEISALLPRLLQSTAQLFSMLNGIITNYINLNSNYKENLRITNAIRAQPNWSNVEISWERADSALGELHRLLGRLSQALTSLDEDDVKALSEDIDEIIEANMTLRDKLKNFAVAPDNETIYWLALSARQRELSLHAAPINVSDKLNELLYPRKRSIIMTSATLSTEGNFDHIMERVGFPAEDNLLLDSPFDYPSAAVLCLPKDMPEPRSWAYQDALADAIKDAAIAAEGRTMALFTSYSALRGTASSIRDDLKARGIEVLQQGNDGPPAQVVRRFMQNPRAVLLGTSSFWEGVDLPGDALSVLIVARLPFTVPSEPVFQARSELYDNAFMQFAVPEAILRLRQGFGRLIRTKTDRGAVIILDRRVTASRYGSAFLRSLPPARRVDCELYQIPGIIRSHLA